MLSVMAARDSRTRDASYLLQPPPSRTLRVPPSGAWAAGGGAADVAGACGALVHSHGHVAHVRVRVILILSLAPPTLLSAV